MIRLYIDLGYVLDLDSVYSLAMLLYVAIHEIAHAGCCHGATDDLMRAKCQEVLADINGANATCDFIEALIASMEGSPPSEFMLSLLHLLCSHIQEERDKYNTPLGRSIAAECKEWSDDQVAAGGQGGCECTEGPDPCSDCPDFPDPGDDPDLPYGGGDVIPHCDACDHI